MTTGIHTARYYRILTVVLAAGVIGFSFLVWYAGHRATVERNNLCAVLYLTVARQHATIGLPGTSGYAYYRGHPTELALAKAESSRALDELPCGPP